MGKEGGREGSGWGGYTLVQGRMEAEEGGGGGSPDPPPCQQRATKDGAVTAGELRSRYAPLCDIPGPWTVTRSSLRVLRRVSAFGWLLQPVFLVVSLP